MLEQLPSKLWVHVLPRVQAAPLTKAVAQTNTVSTLQDNVAGVVYATENPPFATLCMLPFVGAIIQRIATRAKQVFKAQPSKPKGSVHEMKETSPTAHQPPVVPQRDFRFGLPTALP